MHDLSDFEAKLLVDSTSLEHTRALLNRVEKMRDVMTRKLDENPQINDKDIKLDFRFQLGYIKAVKDILNIPDTARDFLQNTR